MTKRRFPLALDQVGQGKTRAPDPKKKPSPSEPKARSEAALKRKDSVPVAAPAMAGSTAAASTRSTVTADPGVATPAVRARMVARLAAEGVRDTRVLDAMSKVPRDAFIDSALVTQAYEDTALPIGHGQTISKPSIVARMLALLHEGEQARRLGHLGRTLEIGTGCGYQAALLSLLAPSVISIERLRALHDSARESLAEVPQARRTALRLVLADGRLGHPPNAPYDSIIAAAVGNDLPQAWIDQLAVGGRLVAPQGQGDTQALVVVDRKVDGVVHRIHEAVRFVPLESGVVR